MAEGLMVNPKTKVIFYLFKIEHGVFWWDTDRIDKAGFCNFDNGRYKFSLKFHGYVEYKEGPYAVDIVVDFQGGDIINADIYDEDTE